MTDLHERFRPFREASAPDLWSEIERRGPRPAKGHVSWQRLGVAALALAVAGAGLTLAIRAFSQQRPGPASTAEPKSPEPPAFPGASREGEKVVMPIAFLNGTTAEMVYPAHLALEEVQIQPAGSLYSGVPDFQFGTVRSSFVVQYKPSDDGRPIESYDPPQNGIVRKWKAEPTAYPQTFRLGDWLVEVPLGYVDLTEEEEGVLLNHLFGLETEAGFLMLEATPPIQMWQGNLVAQFYFDVDDLIVMDRCIDFSLSADDSFMQNGIRVFRIAEGADVGVDQLSWCDRTGQFGVSIREGAVADALIEGLSFRDIHRAGPDA